MKSAIRLDDLQLQAFYENWGWFLLWGIALVILGLGAISAVTLTTVISIVFLGMLILISGVVVLIDTLTFWWRRKTTGFFLHLIMSLIYIFVGLALIESPVISSISITLVLGVLYFLLGLFRTTYSLFTQQPQWGWSFFNGIIALIIGILILANWPTSGLIIIGLFVGIDLIFCGWAYIITALAAHSLLKKG